MIQEHHSLHTTAHVSILARSHDRAQNDHRPYHFCAMNEYTDGHFLAGGCGSRQRQVADGADRADVVFTDAPNCWLITISPKVHLTYSHPLHLQKHYSPYKPRNNTR